MSGFTQVLRWYVTSAAFILFPNVFVGVGGILPSISLGNKVGREKITLETIYQGGSELM